MLINGVVMVEVTAAAIAGVVLLAACKERDLSATLCVSVSNTWHSKRPTSIPSRLYIVEGPPSWCGVCRVLVVFHHLPSPGEDGVKYNELS